MSNYTNESGWFSWLFTTSKKNAHARRDSTHVGYDRMEDSCQIHSSRLDAGISSSSSRRPASADSVYGYGYSTYQMAGDVPPDSYDYDLQMRRKNKKPHVTSFWARFKYWIQYAWKMFKVGLMASGPNVSSGPMMAPPPMVSLTSRHTRHRFSKEAPTPNVYM